MIADQACAERGCACHDYREGTGVEMVRREWQGLTDEQIEQCMKQAYATVQGRNLEHAFASAIEAALKEKNT